MAKVLHIQASPRGDASISTQLARAFLDKLAEVDPAMEVDTLDLFAADLPAFAAPAAKAKYAVMAGEEPLDDAGRAWRDVIAIIARLKAADQLVISAPMWNFSIPYRLKHYIDLITQPGLTFTYDSEAGYVGLLTGRPAALLLARGGDYGPVTGMEQLDMQLPYLTTLLNFIGVRDIHPIIVQPTLQGGADTTADRLRAAIAQAAELAPTFATTPAARAHATAYGNP